MKYRNHEGYHDPTAGKAIRRASRTRSRKKAPNRQYLTYRLDELPGFRKARRLIKG